MRYSLLHSIAISRDRAKQKRTALRMMTLSGVIRPSHVELRYGTQPAISSASCRQPETAEIPLFIEQAPAHAWHHEIAAGTKQIWRWVRITSRTVMQQALKSIGPQWTID